MAREEWIIACLAISTSFVVIPLTYPDASASLSLRTTYAAILALLSYGTVILVGILLPKKQESLPGSSATRNGTLPKLDIETEKRLRTKYPNTFLILHSIASIGNQRDFENLWLRIKNEISLESMKAPNFQNTMRDVVDEHSIESYAYALLQNKKKLRGRKRFWER